MINLPPPPQDLQWVRSDVSNWLAAYVGSRFWLGEGAPFTAGLHEFLASEEGLQYSQSIKFKDGWRR
jgi:hypothetical protein